MSRSTRFLWGILPVLVLLSILSYHFSTNYAVATEQPSPNWSRPVTFGSTTYSGATVPAVMDSGRTLAFTTEAEGIALTILSPDGKVLGHEQLDIAGKGRLGFSVIGGKQADLFWMVEDSVYHAVVSEEGKLAGQPVKVASNVKAYVARSGPGGAPVVVAYVGAQGITLYRQTGSEWAMSGVGKALFGVFQSLDAQVMPDGKVIAFAHVAVEDNHHKLILLRGPISEGLTDVSTVYEFAIKTRSGMVSPVALGVDKTHGYGFYSVETNDKGNRETALYVVSGKHSEEAAWTNQPVAPGGRVSERVSVGQLYNPTVVAGAGDTLDVGFLAQTSSRFNRSLGMVMATYKGGERTALELLFHGKSALRPSIGGTGNNRVLTFASFGADNIQTLQAISAQPAFIAAMQKTTSQDITQAFADTLFDAIAMVYALASAAFWFLPMLGVVAIMYLFALTWVERNAATVFWIGVVIALPIQIYVARWMFTQPVYTERMPGWLASMPPAICVGISLLTLASVWHVKRPAKYVGPLGPLAWWGIGTAVQVALLFGPFVRKG